MDSKHLQKKQLVICNFKVTNRFGRRFTCSE